MSTSSSTEAKSDQVIKEVIKEGADLVNRTKVQTEASPSTPFSLFAKPFSVGRRVQPLLEMLSNIFRKMGTCQDQPLRWTGANNLASSWLPTKMGQQGGRWKLAIDELLQLFASMPKSGNGPTSGWRKVAFSLENWKMAIQKQQNSGNGSVTKVSLNLTASMDARRWIW